MAKRKLNYFQKRILFILGIGLLIVILLLFIFFYLRFDILKRNKKIEEDKSELLRRQQMMERIQKLESEIKEADPYFLKLKEILLSETEVVNLEAQLKSIALKYNLDFNFRFGTLNQETTSEPKHYTFNLTISGRLDNLIKWLEEISQKYFSLRFDKVEINQTKEGSVSKTKKGNEIITQTIPPSYEIKIVGKVYLR